MADNNDFLRQFFKDNDLFSDSSTPIKQKAQQEKKEQPLEKNSPPTSISQKDINLKAMFSSIEEEKKKQQDFFQRKISEKKEQEKKEGLIALIKLQSEARTLFENFLKILPIVEMEFHLDEVQEHKSRESRGEQEYIPEIWETNSNVIFFETQQEEHKTLEIDEYFEEPDQEKAPEIGYREEYRKEPSEINLGDIATKVIESGKPHIQKASEHIVNTHKNIQKKVGNYFEVASNKYQQIKNQSQEKSKKEQEIDMQAIIDQQIENERVHIKSFTQDQTKLDRTHHALIRAKKRAIARKEKKRDSGFTEFLKISSIVAGLFFISMLGLNFSAIVEWSGVNRTLNASAFEEQKISISSLLDEKSNNSENQNIAKNPRKSLQMLPVAGSNTNKENKSGFDSRMYLDIAPPDTRIIIPKIAKNIPIISVSDNSRKKENWNQLEKEIQNALKDGVVHYPGTAQPGQFGNAFITGHSSYYPWDNGKYKDVFAALHDLEVGDEYYIFHKGKKYRYVITTRKVIKPSDVSVLEQDTSKRTSTLMTCTPIGTTARRLILQAEQIDET